MELTLDTAVGTIATEHPLATKVFARHGIDFCCGGGKPIGTVCEELGLATEALLTELKGEIAKEMPDTEKWSDAPLRAIIDHILVTYHEPLYEELPRLEFMAHKVNEVHGYKDPERLGELAKTVTAIKNELIPHMQKEEQVLFPMIREGHGEQARPPITVMEHEHVDAGNMLKRLRELTNDYTVPEEACNTWRALWHGLAALEEETHCHIHLENNVLFPRALKGDLG